MSDVTRILSQIESGDPHAAEKLLPLVYDELRKLAAVKLAQEKPGQTLQATALVHEAYVRLVGGQESGARSQESEGTLTPALSQREREEGGSGTAAGIFLGRRRRRCGEFWLIMLVTRPLQNEELTGDELLWTQSPSPVGSTRPSWLRLTTCSTNLPSWTLKPARLPNSGSLQDLRFPKSRMS
jgi:hypothetical protein